MGGTNGGKMKKPQGEGVVFLRTVFIIFQQKNKRLQPEAPSGRELAPQATEGERVKIKLAEI